MTAIYRRVGSRIQTLRMEHGLTQNELAEKADVGVSYLVKLESGVRKARLETLERLARALGEPLWRFISDWRLSPDETKWRGEVEKLAEILPRLAPEGIRALIAVAQQLANRRDRAE